MNYSKENNAVSVATSAVLSPEKSEPSLAASVFNRRFDANRNSGVTGIVMGGHGEPIPGQRVALFAGITASGTPIGTATTDEDGCYFILHAGKEGAYSVKVVPPFPAGTAVVAPDPAVISIKADGIAAAGIFVFE